MVIQRIIVDNHDYLDIIILSQNNDIFYSHIILVTTYQQNI